MESLDTKVLSLASLDTKSLDTKVLQSCSCDLGFCSQVNFTFVAVTNIAEQLNVVLSICAAVGNGNDVVVSRVNITADATIAYSANTPATVKDTDHNSWRRSNIVILADPFWDRSHVLQS